MIFWQFLNGKKKKRKEGEKERQPQYFSQKEQEAWKRKYVTVYFSTSPRYRVNEIPLEAINMETGGWLCADGTQAPRYLDHFFKAELLMKANYCTFPKGNTESFMKWSKISKLAYTIFFFFLLSYLCQKQAQKSQAGPKLALDWSNLTKTPDALKGDCPTRMAGSEVPPWRGEAPVPSLWGGLWLTSSGTAIIRPYPWPASKFHV